MVEKCFPGVSGVIGIANLAGSLVRAVRAIHEGKPECGTPDVPSFTGRTYFKATKLFQLLGLEEQV